MAAERRFFGLKWHVICIYLVSCINERLIALCDLLDDLFNALSCNRQIPHIDLRILIDFYCPRLFGAAAVL